MRYTVVFDEKFKQAYRKLDASTQKQIKKKLFKLEENPSLGKHLIASEYWSLRVGKYRIIYKIYQEKLMVLLLKLDHRKKAYKGLSMLGAFKDIGQFKMEELDRFD